MAAARWVQHVACSQKKPWSPKSSICHVHSKFVADVYPLACFATFIQSELCFDAKYCKLQLFLINRLYEGAAQTRNRELLNGIYHHGNLTMANDLTNLWKSTRSIQGNKVVEPFCYSTHDYRNQIDEFSYKQIIRVLLMHRYTWARSWENSHINNRSLRHTNKRSQSKLNRVIPSPEYNNHALRFRTQVCLVDLVDKVLKNKCVLAMISEICRIPW